MWVVPNVPPFRTSDYRRGGWNEREGVKDGHDREEWKKP